MAVDGIVGGSVEKVDHLVVEIKLPSVIIRILGEHSTSCEVLEGYLKDNPVITTRDNQGI